MGIPGIKGIQLYYKAVVIELFIFVGTSTEKCFNEYVLLLKDIDEWMAETMNEISKLANQNNPIVSTETQGIDAFTTSHGEIADALMLYKAGVITKLELLHRTFPPENEQQLSTDTINLVAGLKTNYAQRIMDYTNNIKDLSIVHYNSLMKFSEDLASFFSETYIYDLSGRMFLWRKPVVNFENPTQIKDEGRPFWDVWDSTDSIAVFNDRSDEEIKSSVTPYIESITNDINDFSFQLTALETSVQNDIQLIWTEYQGYLEAGELNSNFIQ